MTLSLHSQHARPDLVKLFERRDIANNNYACKNSEKRGCFPSTKKVLKRLSKYINANVEHGMQCKDW